MKVSVIVTTYNHEKYISQALDSVITQKFDGDLEIIIGDDCSKDSTPEIIEEYKKSNIDTIIIPKNKYNLGITKNLQRCIKHCTGEYIAICEGDDYWVDDKKIEKQVNYLESNIDCSMCFNKLYLYYQDQDAMIIHPSQEKIKTESKFTIKDLIYDNFIGNFSCCMYRKKLVDFLNENIYNFYTVDWMFNMAISEFGKIGFIDEVMSVYRIHGGGAWSGNSEEKKLLDWIECIDVYDEFFKRKYKKEFRNLKKRIYANLYAICGEKNFIKKMILYGYKSKLTNLIKK